MTFTALSASFGAVTYTQTSTTGLTVSTATQPYELDDIQLAATTTIFPQQLTAMTFGYGVLAGTTAQTVPSSLISTARSTTPRPARF